MLLQLDEMIEREHAKGEPDRGRGKGAHFEQRQRHDPASEADLEINRVAGRPLDLVVEIFANMHDVSSGVGMLGEKFSLFLDLLGDVVEFRRGWSRRRAVMLLAMAAQMVVEIVVPLRVVINNNAAGGRIDLGALNARNAGELLAKLR